MVVGLEISRFIDEFIGLYGNVNEKREKYYEEIYVVQKDFYVKVNWFLVMLQEMGNLFEEELLDLYSLDIKYVFEIEIVDEILKIGDEGREQYRLFILRFCEGEYIGFYELVKKNKFCLFILK